MSSRVVHVGCAACVGLGLMLLSMACQPAEPRMYTVHGVVKQLLAEQNRVEIEHEEIPGFMPAMTMEFEVREPGLLRGLRPEEPIRFRLEHHADSLYLIAVERLAGEDPPDVRHGSEESPTVAAPERSDAQPDPESVVFTPFPAPDSCSPTRTPSRLACQACAAKRSCWTLSLPSVQVRVRCFRPSSAMCSAGWVSAWAARSCWCR